MTASAARAAAEESARAYESAFSERMVGVYLLGSLAYGGYSPAVSDIDLAVVLAETRETDRATMDTTTEALRAKGGPYPKLSVFWSSLPALREGRDDGRFPALDRLQLADHGVVLLGSDVTEEVARPAAGELLSESARFAVTVLATDEVIAEFHRPNRLRSDPVWFTKAVLFPIRFLYTATTTSGRAATNEEALAWYLAQPAAPALSLVRLAERVRAGRPLDPTLAERELAAGLIPLYQHYVEDQTDRLHRAKASTDLITAFTHWGRRLLTG